LSILNVSTNPTFHEEIEAFSTSDPQHSSEFNARMAILFENEIVLRRDKAEKSVTYDKIILAVDWKGDSEPYSNEIGCDCVTESNNVEVIPGTLSTEQWESMSDAGIVSGTQENDKITLFAFGNKPTIDLPIKVIIRGD